MSASTLSPPSWSLRSHHGCYCVHIPGLPAMTRREAGLYRAAARLAESRDGPLDCHDLRRETALSLRDLVRYVDRLSAVGAFPWGVDWGRFGQRPNSDDLGHGEIARRAAAVAADGRRARGATEGPSPPPRRWHPDLEPRIACAIMIEEFSRLMRGGPVDPLPDRRDWEGMDGDEGDS